jgi:hypothetical protein
MISFIVFGNQDDQGGNPIGYTRLTQGMKRWHPKAKRYHAWKDFVWVSLLRSYPKPPRLSGVVRVICRIDFATDARRPDPSNVTKGIADALADQKIGGFVEHRLYPNDRNVLECTEGFKVTGLGKVFVKVETEEEL